MKTVMSKIFTAILIVSAFAGSRVQAEDGYDLWLRYRPIEPNVATPLRAIAARIVVPPNPSTTMAAARDELIRGLEGMLARSIPVAMRVERGGAIVLGTSHNSSIVAGLGLELGQLGSEGYLIRSATASGLHVTVIAANSDVGVLYGAFAFLRLLQTRQSLADLDIASAPRIQLRTLNHWDNIDGTVERGFAGHSIFDWHRLPDWIDPRLSVYARANASIGINGAVLNNVNANATILTEPYLRKTAAIAAALRPYGIKVYLTARFSAPAEIGGLNTADPLDPAVRTWWRAKADEIYRIIPDFGGFLVKANSEGQPGPQDYHRTHVDGANMLAEALAPHGGVVMWRAFVYTESPVERAMRAYDEFRPLDGQFQSNVLIQTKNGPLDFQPREAIHPMFGALPRSPVSMELQITKEYLGQSTHLVFLAPMWKEVLDTDTYVQGEGSTVARVVDGSLFQHAASSIAGVANIGTDRNWSGSHFDQANWYAFGRLAWDHRLSSNQIAEEWTRMTFSNDARFVHPVVEMLLASHETVVDYMGSLGLTWTISATNHYAPAPWEHANPDWNLVHYDAAGIGFDRTHTGSNAVAQYAPRLAAEYDDIKTTPENLLLWFHHVPWDYRVASGRTVWAELVYRYTRGAESVRAMRATWTTLRRFVDQERFDQVATFLGVQEREARWWRDACVAYFQSISKRPLPPGFAPPAHALDYYKSLGFPYAPGVPGRTAAPTAPSARDLPE